MNDNFKKFMTFTRSERIAVIAIVTVIVIILIIKYLIIINPPKRTYFVHDLDSIVARRNEVLDSIRIADSIEKASNKSEIPRYARNDRKRHAETTEKAEKRTANDRLEGKSFHEMTTIIDLNSADTAMLQQLPGIGPTFAKRIVEYRSKLGGYHAAGQLLEVFDMDSSRYEKFKDKIKIDSSFEVNKLKINSDEFKVLLRHPYLEYEEVKKIVNHREQKGLITSWEQLEKVAGDAINPKLKHYVDYN